MKIVDFFKKIFGKNDNKQLLDAPKTQYQDLVESIDDLEQQKREKYNSNTLFSNQNKSINKDTALVEYTKEKWYKKFINKIINIFKRNK